VRTREQNTIAPGVPTASTDQSMHGALAPSQGRLLFGLLEIA
jgi:hypothetical protein